MSFNKVIIMGNLTRDPELRSTPGGSQLTDITLAINETWKSEDGTKHERVHFIDVTFWGKSAETLCRWKKKGDPLLVEGELNQDRWTDKESGKERSRVKVKGTGFTFISRGGGGDKADGKPGADPRRQFENNQGTSSPGGYDDYATSLPSGGEEPSF